MRKSIIIVLFAILLLGASSFSRKPPNDVYYPITIDKIGDFISDMDYKYDKITTSEGLERINLKIQGDNGVYDINVLLFEELEMVYVYISEYLTLPLDEPSSGLMLTYLMNQNWLLTFGKFEWDIEDGEVRYSHTLPIDDGMSKETFQAYFTSMLSMADEKYPELLESLEEFTE